MSRRAILITAVVLWTAVGAASAQTATTRPSTESLRRAAIRASYEALHPTEPDPSLRAAVERLEASRLTAAKPQPASAPAEATDASQTAPEAQITEPTPTTAPAEPATQPAEDKFAKALQKIRTLPVEAVPDPVALADALYLAGHIEAAAVFYEKALGQQKDDATRAWLLFQLGNCHRKPDPDTAQGYYARVLKEHPKCPWALAAEMHDRLIEWRKTNKPEEMLAQVNEELRNP